MPLHRIPEDELRGICRTRIEILELWLRRLIQHRLISVYGASVLQAKHPNGDYVVGKEMRDHVEKLRAIEPGRFARDVDAMFLDDLIAVICNQAVYKACFRGALVKAFPNGNAEARTFFTRLIEPRNRLSHANPMSVRQAEQVVCYSGDVIESLKAYFAEIGMADGYDAPRIIRMWDSFGNVVNAPADPVWAHRTPFLSNPLHHMHPGDRLTVEVEIDMAGLDTVEIRWLPSVPTTGVSSKLELLIDESHVAQTFVVGVFVVSPRKWHRFGHADDCWQFEYRVLPPLSN